MSRVGTLGKRFKDAGIVVTVIVGGLLWLLSGTSMSYSAPENAHVYVDDRAGVYYAPLQETMPLDRAGLRLTTIGEAHRRGYSPDPASRDWGAFVQDIGFIRNLLHEIGVWPLRLRWNADGTWNW